MKLANKRGTRGQSIQTKTTLLTVLAIVVTLVVATAIGVVAVRDIGNTSSEEMLMLLCETGEKNLDSYFESVEQSTEMVSSVAKDDLNKKGLEQLNAHVEHIRDIFADAAKKTHGVMTYYYRIDPKVSEEVKGFWYVDADGEGLKESEVTDITQYDTDNTNELVWFTVPKATGKPMWLPSYVTDNLDVRVISYNVPIYYEATFVGVIGIEIGYETMAEQVNNIRIYENGYAFINDAEGNIVYHPHVDVLQLTEDNKLKVPDSLLEEKTLVKYRYNGVEKMAVWLPLSNGLRLTVAVPVSEINSNWLRLINEILIAAFVLLIIFIGLTILFTKHFTKPLRDLTDAAEQLNAGNYNVKLDYQGNDEVGLLTDTVNQLIGNLKGYIEDLNSLAYGDALTSVRNKGAFDIHIREIQGRMDDPGEHPEFAIGMFDCDDLKMINDKYGHDKGDMYLKNSSHLMCRVFKHSPVYRIGGDEFAVILQNKDYYNRDKLAKYFADKSKEICNFANEPWEQIRVALGIAEYNEKTDRQVYDVMRRADRLMYENKRDRKGDK